MPWESGPSKVLPLCRMPNKDFIHGGSTFSAKEELAAIREARFTIREGEIQNIGLNPGGKLCAGQGFTTGSGHFPLFPDPFVEMGIDSRVWYVYQIVIEEIGYSYFLVNFDELLAMPSKLIDTAIGKIRLSEAHYVIFQRVKK